MKKLYTPIKIGSMELKNRIAMSPISTGYENEDCTMGGLLADYWIERAKGGVGMIIVDAVGIDVKVPYLAPNTLSLGDDKFIAPFKAFNDEVHKYGAKVIPQLAHFGAESCTWRWGVPSIGPSAYTNQNGGLCREMRLEEIPGVIKKYGEAARRAREAGCDGVEFHCAHAYMLAGSFLSPLRNKRTDEYGGELQNRARLAIEIIKEMKSAAGQDFPIFMRVCGSERVPGGNTLEDMLYLAPQFVAAGCDGFEISGATSYEMMDKLIPCSHAKPGVNVEEAKAIKKVVDVPVFVVGKINSARFAEHLVDSGYVDGVVLGRPLLADPAWANKAREGRYDDIAPCASCGGPCLTRGDDGRGSKCVINPMLGNERAYAYGPAEKIKKVVVVGGGPAGLEAAMVAAERGHKVTLLEKSHKVGGQINLAAVPPFKQDISRWITYLSGQVKKQGVNVCLNTEATVEEIKGMNPDAVVVATGSLPFIPKVKGIENIKVVTGHMVLKGEEQIVGGNVLVVGGSLVGCETADYILQYARGPLSVHIIEMLDDVVKALFPINRNDLLGSLAEGNVQISVSTKLLEIRGTEGNYQVVVEKDGQEQVLSGFTHILFCAGARPNDTLTEALNGVVPEVHVIGDAKKVGMAHNATADGFLVGKEL